MSWIWLQPFKTLRIYSIWTFCFECWNPFLSSKYNSNKSLTILVYCGDWKNCVHYQNSYQTILGIDTTGQNEHISRWQQYSVNTVRYHQQTNFFALHYGVLLTTMHLRYWKHFSTHIQCGRLIWCALNQTCIHSIVTEPLCSQLHSFIVCVSYKYMDSETIAFSAVQSVLHSHTYTRVHNPIRKYTRLEFVDFFERFSSKPFSIEKHLGN